MAGWLAWQPEHSSDDQYYTDTLKLVKITFSFFLFCESVIFKHTLHIYHYKQYINFFFFNPTLLGHLQQLQLLLRQQLPLSADLWAQGHRAHTELGWGSFAVECRDHFLTMSCNALHCRKTKTNEKWCTHMSVLKAKEWTVLSLGQPQWGHWL